MLILNYDFTKNLESIFEFFLSISSVFSRIFVNDEVTIIIESAPYPDVVEVVGSVVDKSQLYTGHGR